MINDIKGYRLSSNFISSTNDLSLFWRRFLGICIIIVCIIGMMGCEPNFQDIDTIDADVVEVQPDITPDTNQDDAGVHDSGIDTVPLAPLCSETEDDRLGGCTFKSCTCDDNPTHAICWLQDMGGNEIYTRNCVTRHGQLCVPVGMCHCAK